MEADAEAGAFQRQYRALTSGAGLRVLDDRVIVRVTGDDRVSFFHGMCSNDIKRLRTGGVLYALFLTEHAHVIADCFVWATENALLIEADRAWWPRTRAHLEKLLVADDVELEESETITVIDLEGPRSSELISRLKTAAPAPQPWSFVRDGDLLIGNLSRIGIPAFTILAPEPLSHSFAGERAVARLGDAIAVGNEALDTIRIENGIAKVGVDTGDQTIALEARLERAISFDKGCYLGQETIERATARGGLKKRLFGLRFDGPHLPEPGAIAMLDGKEVGHVSSAASSPRLGAIGLSILHHSAWTPGAKLEIRDRSARFEAVVSDLPFK